MRMYEAAESVLRTAGGPMSVRELQKEIVARGLFEFGAKDPVSVLSQALRARCVGGQKGSPPVFVRTAPGTYGLAT